ncbi:hypothetical protein [Nitrosospira briensis]|uniref:hypothetical protein n=1 Tax=Nitrosospira briensis TaxID=35799 RepID=UPI0008ECD77E|nr:hypothetical protein [Nitrosospira briensis]SFN90787.1 hypothetical protein SAMN05216332_102291 [Nitrosospira briensis]
MTEFLSREQVSAGLARITTKEEQPSGESILYAEAQEVASANRVANYGVNHPPSRYGIFSFPSGALLSLKLHILALLPFCVGY